MLSDFDARDILTKLEKLQPTIFSALDAVVTKKAAFDAFPILNASALVLHDLQLLAGAVAIFESSLLASTPVRRVPIYPIYVLIDIVHFRAALSQKPSKQSQPLLLPSPKLLLSILK